jgi:predicted AAA+ superfamily ATPase
MFEQEIQRKIEDFRVLGIPAYVQRDGAIHIVKNTVSTIIGARRAGKSYRTFQVADEFIKNGTIGSIRNICLLDFDNPILSGMKAEELKIIPDIFLKISPEFELNTPLVFIFDEIHKIKGWEEAVTDLSRNPNWQVIVTGSSSKLLRSDIATELRGKSISSTMYPLSFSEFLRFKKINESYLSTKSQAAVKRLFDEYLKWGGYPAIVGIEEGSKEVLLREYFDTMIMRDIIQRYDISKPRACIQLCSYLLSNISRPTTYHSSFEYIKGAGFITSRTAIKNYVDWAIDAWFIFLTSVFSNSRKEQERNYKKAYCIDWGLACQNSAAWDGSFSRAFENMIFLHLARKFTRVHFYLTKSKRQEVDFIALDNKGVPVLAVQVCMDISHADTLAREMEPLIATSKYFKTKENLIITLNQEKVFHEGEITISALPAWKWLAGESA